MLPKPLELHDFPLSGISLIEAGAGTGKTYTIAGLYLRLLLERKLSVRQILVVTFTNAATEELRDRVRQGIRAAMLGFAAGQSDNSLVVELLERYPEHAEAVSLLKDALACMDEAAIYTIHGFCQRLLQEHAFESGALFDAEFIKDERDYLQAITEDFWRRHFYVAEPSMVAWVKGQWATPSALLAAIRPYVKREELVLLPAQDEHSCQRIEQQYLACVGQLREIVQREGNAAWEILRTHKGINRNKYRSASVEVAINSLLLWLDEPYPPPKLPERVDLLTLAKLSDALKSGFELPRHRCFECCEQLMQLHQQRQESLRLHWLQSALVYVREELSKRKVRAQVISLDDLLSHSQAALHSEAGAALAKQLRDKYPVALIDEFQDTDSAQYDVFRTVYQGWPDVALWMIGDPKQAIYSFRGADIFTYMQARHDTPDHYTLDTNWRSSANLVKVVNALFDQASKPFVYDQDIPFRPAKCSGRADKTPLLLEGDVPLPMQVWLPEEGEATQGIAKKDIVPELANICAAEVTRLLNLASAGQARIGNNPLTPSDIAILVRDRHEAAALQKSLRDQGVASAFLSRDSVFNTAEAVALQSLLLAIAEPANERLLRAALCGPILLASASELEALLVDENQWEQVLNEFQEYHGLWQSSGFMTMFQRLLHWRELPHRLLKLEEGERRLTNLLQLAELLQQASHQQHGMDGLLHWYHQLLLQPEGEHEEQQLRLESDADLVQIVTIHKSKGLEYPIVFLPFIWGSRPVDGKKPVLFHAEVDNRLCLDARFLPDDAHRALADRERLAEDLRLLYVALTRAKYLCYLSWGPFKGAETSALGYLLHGPEQFDITGVDVRAPWVRLAQQLPDAVALLPLRYQEACHYQGRPGVNSNLAARVFDAHIDSAWRLTSYTALVSRQGVTTPVDFDDTYTEAAEIAPRSPTLDIFQFPRGAKAGRLFHALFESLDFPHAKGETLTLCVEKLLRQYGFESSWQPVVEKMLMDVLDTPLAQDLCLRNITRERRLVEMEFYYPLAQFSAEGLNGLLGQLADYKGEIPALDFRPQQGMMTGFIDLVFEHGGRYFLVDYKSNHLGDGFENYAPHRLQSAMLAHRYDLQYLIYTVALHRYLRLRIADYDYERDFGGVYYLFLRGMSPATGVSTGVYHCLPSYNLVSKLDGFFSAERQGDLC